MEWMNMDKVKAGQKINIAASTWNSFIDGANYAKNMQGSGVSAVASKGMFKTGIVLVKNDAGKLLKEFTPVALTDLIITPEKNEKEFKTHVPVLKAEEFDADNKETATIAILQEPVDDGKLGRAMLLGTTPAKVNIQDKEHLCATPNDSGKLESDDKGDCRIIWKADDSGEQWTLLLLGGGGKAAWEYDGPFAVEWDSEIEKIKVKAGYLSRNGEWLKVEESELAPSEGYICVCSKIDDEGNWSEPEVKIATPAKDTYPIGYCKMNDGKATISCYGVPVVILIVTDVCDSDV
jgi:hypothetical protein